MQAQKQFVSYLWQRVGVQTLLVVGIVVFGALIVRDNFVRFDLTEDHRFSISEASHRLAAGLEDPLTIRAYFSDNLPPRIEPLQRQVFDILAEYEAHSDGKITVERYNPLESTQAQSEADNYGIRPVQLSYYEATQASSLQVFGGIVMLYRDRASEVINISERYPQGYEGLSVLEYEISSKIWQLANEKPKLGLCGNLERPGMGHPMMGGGQPRPEFTGLRRVLGDAFEIEEIDLAQEEPDPGKMPLLLVVRPKEFSDVELFRLDQYLVKGGRVLMMITEGLVNVGPPQPGSRQRSQYSYEPFRTGLDEWLQHHGLRVPNEFVLHLRNAVEDPMFVIQEVPGLGRVAGMLPEPNWFWPIFGLEGSINQENPATQTLPSVMLFWPHPVDVLQDRLGDKTATVLLQSHAAESWRWKEATRIDRRYLDLERDGPSPSDFQSSPVAVALEGVFSSYFADKPVPPSLAGGDDAADEESDDEANGEQGDEAGEEEPPAEEQASAPEVVKQNAEPTQLVVIGNAVFISDLVLGGEQGNEDQARMAGLLAFNLVDWLARSKELIALRAKRYSNRALVDDTFEQEDEKLQQQRKDGELTREEYVRKFEELRERQKRSWKRWRWINVLVPSLLALVAGAIVWIVRAGMRARPVEVPSADPPESTQV